jgi:hypothetical protein
LKLFGCLPRLQPTHTQIPISVSVALLRGSRPDLVNSLYASAQKAARKARNQAAASQPVLPRGGQEGNQNASHTNTDNKENIISIRREKHGTNAAYALRRLKRAGREDLHAQCLTGELTPHAAMIAAGLRQKSPSRKRTPLERLYVAWERVSPDDRARFLIEMLTPALAFSVCSSAIPIHLVY